MELVSVRDEIVGKGHSEILMRQVDAALAGAGLAYADLRRIAVTVGPGSFTGVRVGVAAARGLALALDLPLVGVNVLEALAFPWLRQGGAVLAVQDARRGEVFLALYDAQGHAVGAPQALPPEQLADSQLLAGHDIVQLVGTGAALVRPFLNGLHIAEQDPEGLPQLSAIGAIAAMREPGPPVSPLYLRGADAKPQTPVPGIVRTSLPSA